MITTTKIHLTDHSSNTLLIILVFTNSKKFVLKKIKTNYLKNYTFYKNYFFLNVSRGLNLILPLFITPYLIRICGLSHFGSIALLQTLTVIFIILGNFGLDVINIMQISKNRNDPKSLNKIIVDNYLIKTINLLVLFPLFYLGAIIFAGSSNSNIIISSYLIVIASVYLPDFYFQGTEKVYILMLINIISKILLVTLLLFFVRESNDYIYINLIYGSSQLIVSIAGFLYFPPDLIPSYFSFDLHRLKSIYKKNWLLTLSNLNSNLFSSSTSLLLSLYLSKSDVGLYIAIERIINILKGFVSVLSQALYAPVTLIYHDIQKLLRYYISILFPFALIYFAICLLAFIFAGKIAIFFAIDSSIFIVALRLYLISAILELANLPIIQYLIVSGQNNRYFKLITSISILNLAFNIILIPFFGIFSCIFTMIFCQALIFLYHNPLKFLKRGLYQ